MTEEAKPRRGRKPANQDEIEVITLRRIGLEDRTSVIGEVVKVSRDVARKLQDAGAIKVVI